MENKIATQERTVSERFMQSIINEFNAVTGNAVSFTDNQKRLAQHMFVKVDATLKELEKKRLNENRNTVTPYNWNNINIQKLSIDAVHRIEIGLDALVNNHISIIPYYNNKIKKYDLDLRIGYAGKDYYKRNLAYDSPLDIIYELVHENDVFSIKKRDANNNIESYVLEIKNPFNRGKIIGGFGYIMYKNSMKNKLIIVSEADFKKSMEISKTNSFWKPHYGNMCYKTVVHRTTDKLMIDPNKINISYYAVEEQEEQETHNVFVDDSEQTIEIATKKVPDKKLEKPINSEQSQQQEQTEITPDF
jgi:recombination protein RecT